MGMSWSKLGKSGDRTRSACRNVRGRFSPMSAEVYPDIFPFERSWRAKLGTRAVFGQHSISKNGLNIKVWYLIFGKQPMLIARALVARHQCRRTVIQQQQDLNFEIQTCRIYIAKMFGYTGVVAVASKEGFNFPVSLVVFRGSLCCLQQNYFCNINSPA